MIIVWSVLTVAGIALVVWAHISLPKGTDLMPKPAVILTKKGPYRFVQHPMYIGNVAFVAGLGGLAAGIWNALALGVLADMLMRFWAGLERR